jgi:hypothetical protein
MLEPYAMKVARTVLRGEGSGNGAFLPYYDFRRKPAHERFRVYT